MNQKLYKFLNIENNKYKKIYLFQISLIFFVGILSIFFRHPMSWYDEQVHYARVITYSNDLGSTSEGSIEKGEQELINQSMRTISKSLGEPTSEVISFHWSNGFKDISDTRIVKTKDGSPAAVYSPLVYSPYIIAAWISKMIGLHTISTFLFLRLIGFLTVFILFLFSIRKIPFAKAALIVIALIPTVTISFTAISADTLTYGLLFLVISQFMSIYQKVSLSSNIKSKEIISLIICSLFLTLAKMPAFAVLALYIPLIFIGVKNAKLSRKQNIILGMTFILCIILALAWYMSIKNINGNVSYYGAKNIDQSKQFAVLLAHPLRTIRVFFENITNFPFFDFQLGYSDNTKWTHVPVLISLFSVIGFISSFRIQDENQSIINRKERIIYNLSSKIIFLGIMLLIFLIFLLQSTEVGSEAIVGIQGRYFFAFLPLLIPFSNGKNMLDETQSVKVLFLSTIPLVYYLMLLLVQLKN
ncbi:conserved membrane protein of unknown function [Streptococcus thermophilus]|uniref:DUF2142 domain-containing protein n=1 Tax=Streptococcus thermophilus TaxID=1308 RepID=UPI0015C22A8D|nr:DUF2142 domain-containing protein [Streptococcus thermophilus]CAD0147185.1 conserved membrane protein of unknown function [Streptococcus thermophilus]CAD0150628.1 conserved membrane protein of unknown function [Streptococcus thermophilus]